MVKCINFFYFYYCKYLVIFRILKPTCIFYRNQLEHGINNETQKAIKAVADAHLKFSEDKKKMEEEFAAKMRTLENRVAALGKNKRQSCF